MTTNQASRIGSLSALLGGGLRSLDITEAEHAQAVARYAGLCDALVAHWDDTCGANVIAPQGSFALGTVVRNVHRNDEIDLDAVAIRDIDKGSITQAALKADAGVAVRGYARSSLSGHPEVSECERCWTLGWNGMHMDVLPAVPNREPRQAGILITDKTVREWLPSHPQGYARWFFQQMEEALTAAREAMRTQIAEIPDWQIKTTLQQAVQALKRNRDIYFAGHLEDRPASIIITTLAARAYTGDHDLYDVLRTVSGLMCELVERRDGVWWVPNPVQDEENFADSWAKRPNRAEWFFRWMEAAAEEFKGFGVSSGLHNTVPLLASAFGDRVAEAASLSYGSSINSASTGGRLHIASSGALVAAPAVAPIRRVRGHGFAGGSAN